MLRSRALHGEDRLVAGLPQHLSSCRIHGGHRFVFTLARKLIDAIADDERRGVSESDVDFPLSRQRVRPGFRLGKRRGGSIAIGSAPLRVVKRRALGEQRGRKSGGGDDGQRKAFYCHEILKLTGGNNKFSLLRAKRWQRRRTKRSG